MKIFYLLAFLSVFCINSFRANASHMAGGEITWVCQPNGTYIFKMDLYRECSGTSFFFNTQSLSYQGGSIVMKPDSNRWLTYGAGNISPEGPSGCQRSCDSPAQLGAMQFFPYVSDPVTLNGVPPPGGWLFTWGPLCCRPSSVANLSSPASKSFTLRARMYPYKGRNADHCYDSSPMFNDLPAMLICKNNEFIFNHNAGDSDLDSLVYSWTEPWDNINQAVSYAAGYSYDSPMPDSSIHPLNKAAVLDSQKGEITFAVYSGQSGQQYATTLQVDAYRNGTKIASIYRDIPFILFDCPVLPGTGLPNNPPTATVDSMPAIGFVDTVVAGEMISFEFQSVETDTIYSDPTDSTTARVQQNFIAPSGFLFSNDFTDPTACKKLGIAPCATLNPAPSINPTNGKYELSNAGTVNTTFEWQTTCDHLGWSDTVTEPTAQIHNFIMKTYDDHCDVPGVIYPSISIVVEPYQPQIQQNGNILSVDSADSYRWYFNGNLIPHSDTNQIAMSSNGNYSVQVIKNGCYSKKAYHLLNVSLDEQRWEKNIEIYPNPFKDGFIVEVGSFPQEKLDFELMDARGRKVKATFTKNNDIINIDAGNNLQQGIYILRISTGKHSILKKVVKLK